MICCLICIQYRQLTRVNMVLCGESSVWLRFPHCRASARLLSQPRHAAVSTSQKLQRTLRREKMDAGAEEDEGLLAQAEDDDNACGYFGSWKACQPLSTDGRFTKYSEKRNLDNHKFLCFIIPICILFKPHFGIIRVYIFLLRIWCFNTTILVAFVPSVMYPVSKTFSNVN